MKVTDEIDQFIEQNGGDVRNALSKALSMLKQGETYYAVVRNGTLYVESISDSKEYTIKKYIEYMSDFELPFPNIEWETEEKNGAILKEIQIKIID